MQPLTTRPAPRSRVDARAFALLRKSSKRNPSCRRELLALACQRASLKPRIGGADTQRMFAARNRPLVLVEDRLLALRMSLNAPVLATAELPAGPARAAIVVHAQGASRCFSIVVRSLRNGDSVIYELEGDDLREDSGWAVALDASLSFGESMGFLFDDEMLVDRRPETLRRGLARLHEILAPPDVSDDDSQAVSAPETAAVEPTEILLEDELDHSTMGADAPGSDTTGPFDAPPDDSEGQALRATSDDPEGQALRATSDDPEGQALRAMPVATPVLLSKFRAVPPVRAEAAPPSESPPVPAQPAAAVRGRATLGRVRPVRLRTVDPDAPPKPDPLVRLLADF
jgi:hypothetical protein